MVDDIRIDDRITIPLQDVEIHAVRAQGAGGQNVNKVASAIHLRFDFRNCEALPQRVRSNLASLDDARVTSNGIIIKAQEFRSQARNRLAAIARLQQMIREALVEPKPRVPTVPSKTARKRRVDSKRRQGALKKNRGRVSDDG